MRVLIIQNGVTTELSCQDSLAAFVFAIKEHFDNIERGSMSVMWDKAAARKNADAGAILNPSLPMGKKKQNPLAKER